VDTRNAFSELATQQVLVRQEKEMKRKETLRAMLGASSTFHTSCGIGGQVVRFRSQNISQEVCKVACRRMRQALLNRMGFHQCPNEYRNC